MVLAPSITPDYSLLFGTPPKTYTAEQITAQWEGLFGKLDATQHVTTDIISEVPFPADEPPESAKVFLHVNAYLRKTVNEKVLQTRNGGRMEVELVRLSQEERISMGSADDGGNVHPNPWRIRWFKAFPDYDEGGKEFWATQS